MAYLVRNKLQHDSNYSSANLIALYALSLLEEYVKINLPYHYSPMLHSTGSSPRIWKPPSLGTLKVNTDTSFFEVKIGISILIRNHLGVPSLSKVVPRLGRYSVDYGELLGIILKDTLLAPLSLDGWKEKVTHL